MAIYHYSLRSSSRQNGQSAAQKYDYIRREGKYENVKDNVVAAGAINMPSWAVNDPRAYWQAADDYERENGKLCNSIDIALPSELTKAERLDLAQNIVGKIAHTEAGELPCSWAIHAGHDSNPHMHIIISERANDGHDRTPKTWFNRAAGKGKPTEAGGAKKYRYMKSTAWLKDKRQEWERVCNEKLAECGHEARIDHRSHVDRDITLKPQIHLGPGKHIENSYKLEESLAISRRNGEKIIDDPAEAVRLLTYHTSTFGYNDVAKMANLYSADPEQYNEVLSAIIYNSQIVTLGEDEKGQPRYTTREMLQTEQKMLSATDKLSKAKKHGVSTDTLEKAISESGLSEKQAVAARHIVGGNDVVNVIGIAGSGKSYMLNTIRFAYEAQGYKVRGAALSAVAAKSLQDGSGINSDTIHATLYKWEKSRELLQPGDVFVVDEAGMVGSRQMSKVAEHCEQAGAKLVLVGDSQQLQAVEAGGAFQAIVKQAGYAELDEIRRQRQEWQQEATKQLAGNQQTEAIRAYSAAGFVHSCETDEEAKQQIVDSWRRDPSENKIMLAYRRADVADLNTLARERRIEAGEIEAVGRTFETFKGDREFVAGDHVLFLKNDRNLGVKNGTQGIISKIMDDGNIVVLSEGKEKVFNTEEYNHLDHGYAMTVHKSQGATVDNAYIYASRNFDKHAGYVAMSRHRDDMNLYYSNDQFKDENALAWAFSRNGEKELATAYAEARGIETEGNYEEFAQAAPVYVEQPEAPSQEQQPDYLGKWAEGHGLNKSQAATLLYENKSIIYTKLWNSIPDEIKPNLRQQVNDEYLKNKYEKVQTNIDHKYEYFNDPKNLSVAATKYYNAEKLNSLRNRHAILEVRQSNLRSTRDHLHEQKKDLKFYEWRAKKIADEEIKENGAEIDKTKNELSLNETNQEELKQGVGKNKEQEFFEMLQNKKQGEVDTAHQEIDENHRKTMEREQEKERIQEFIKQNREQQQAPEKTQDMNKDQLDMRLEFDRKNDPEAGVQPQENYQWAADKTPDLDKQQAQDKGQDQQPEPDDNDEENYFSPGM